MSEAAIELTPFPSQLQGVEELIGGMPFYSDPYIEHRARTCPTEVNPDSLDFRIGLYGAVVRSVHAFHSGTLDIDSMPDEDELAAAMPIAIARREEFATRFSAVIDHVRGELMELDSGLRTPPVRRLDEALAELPERHFVVERRDPEREIEKAQTLSFYETTLRSVGRMVDMSRDSARQMLGRMHVKPPLKRLPGSSTSEQIVTWPMVERLKDRVGMIPGVEVYFDILPVDSKETSVEKIAYARQVQRSVVPIYKLLDIPGLVSSQELAEMSQPARPYQLTLSRLERLLGGGYHFIEDYLCKRGLQLACRRRHDNLFGYVEVINKENAASVWDSYRAIPPVASGYTSVLMAAQIAEVSKRHFIFSLNAKQQALLLPMRSQSGHVMQHVPDIIALEVAESLKQRPLPAHRIPANCLSSYLDMTYSGIMSRLGNLPVEVPKLYLPGSPKKQSCCDWSTLRFLELFIRRRPDVEPLDFDKLPLTAADYDPVKIAYARKVQKRLGLGSMLGPEDGTSLGTNLQEDYPPIEMLDPSVQAEVLSMTEKTGFTDEAVIRLLIERGFYLKPGCAEECLPVLQQLIHPRRTKSLFEISRRLNMNPRLARTFLTANRYGLTTHLNEQGFVDAYVDRLSEEVLIRQRFPAGERRPGEEAPHATKGWLSLNNIIPGLETTVEEFMTWVEQYLHPDDMQWMGNDKGHALPHYRLEAITPYVLSHKRGNQGGPPRRGSQ